MENINLTTVEKNERIISPNSLKLMALLFLVALIYVGLLFYGNLLANQTIELTAQYADQRKSFLGVDSREVLDFQNRLILAKKLIGTEKSINEDIDAVGAVITPGTYLDSYKYDDTAQTVTVGCHSDNYGSVARQILGFKSSDYFSSVSIGDTTLDAKTNIIDYSIVLKIKGKEKI